MAFTLGQRLFAHGGIYIASRLANRGIALFLLLPLYTRYLGADGFGAVQVLNYLGLFFALLFSQGLVVAWYRFRFDQKTDEDLKKFESTLIWYLAFSCLVGLGLVSFFGELISERVTTGIPYYPLGFLTVLGACFNVFCNLYERKLQADQKPIAFGIFSTLRTLSNLGLVVILVALLEGGVLGKIGADTLSALILAVLALFYLKPLGVSSFSKGKVYTALSYGLPILPHSLAVIFNEMAGTFIVNSQLGTEEAGVYSLGLKIASLTLVLTLALNQAYSPIFLKTVKSSQKAREVGNLPEAEEFLSQVERSGLLLVTFVGSMALGISAFGREAISFLATSEFSDSWIVVAPISAGIVSFAVYAVFNQVVYYVPARARWIGAVTIVGAATNVCLCFMLVSSQAYLGPAISLFTSNSILAFGTFLLSRGCLPIRFPWRSWGGTLITIYGSILFVWFIDRSGSTLIHSFYKSVVVIFAIPISCAIAGVAPRHFVRFISGAKSRVLK